MYYNSEANIRKIEQALLIWVLAYLVQTLQMVISLPFTGASNGWDLNFTGLLTCRIVFLATFSSLWLGIHFRRHPRVAVSKSVLSVVIVVI